MADIELVIKIPEWKYKSICEGVEASKRCGVVNEIIKHCEDIQDEDISDYHKDRAKVFAYDEIVKIWEGR